MTPVPVTEAGGLLWRLLPLIYRRWDGTHGKDPKHPIRTPEQRGDLAEFLDAHGVMLDQIRATLDQRLLDISPNTCQPWLIPYFADLLDVRLVSPDIEGQREEVARAVAWRQRKGTTGCTADIAQEVGRFERTVVAPDKDAEGRSYSETFPTLHMQEGFRRVVTTARIGVPLPSLRALGLPPDTFTETASPIAAARRPGLPAGTVDFRSLSRAREVTDATPVSRVHAFGSRGVRWQQENVTGVPCYRDTYQDVSARTVDVRSPSWARGHHHPRRILIYSAPRDGFFPASQFEVTWSELVGWFDAFDTTHEPGFIEWEDELGNRIRERALPSMTRPIEENDQDGGQADNEEDNDEADSEENNDEGAEDNNEEGAEENSEEGSGQRVEEIVFIERYITDPANRTTRHRIVGRSRDSGDPRRDYRVERVGSHTFVLITGFELVEADDRASVSLSGFGEKPPRISGANGVFTFGKLAWAAACVLDGVVFHGHLDLAPEEPEAGSSNAVNATFTLKRVAVEQLTANVTVSAAPSDDPELTIADSLIGTLEVKGDGLCRLEYCTVLMSLACPRLQASDCILRSDPEPKVAGFDELYLRYCCAPWAPTEPIDVNVGRLHAPTITRVSPWFLSDSFGEPGCGVLHPGAPAAIRQGAEDGGELGAYHHRHFVLREQAVIDKLRDFLPVSLVPVLVPHGSWVDPISKAP